jgi:serine/threonine-protein kinase RsbW
MLKPQKRLHRAAKFPENGSPWRRAEINTEREIGPALAPLEKAMAQAGYSDEDLFAMRLALFEALANAVRHGNRSDPRRTAYLRYQVDASQVLAEVRDEGDGFDPTQVADPLSEERLTESGGRGLFLMRSLTTWLRYNARGNVLTLCKQRSG